MRPARKIRGDAFCSSVRSSTRRDSPTVFSKPCSSSTVETGLGPKKGSDAYDLGGFLSHLFRGGILLQPVVVSCRRPALAFAPAAFFRRPCSHDSSGGTRDCAGAQAGGQ